MRLFTRMALPSPRRTPPKVFFPFPLCYQFVNALSEQTFIQDTWWLMPRVKKAVSLQSAFGLLGSCWLSLAVVHKSEWSPLSVGLFDMHLLLDYIAFHWLVNIWEDVCFRNGICKDFGLERVDLLGSYMDLLDALDDGKNHREKNEEISWAYVVIEEKQPLQLVWLRAK